LKDLDTIVAKLKPFAGTPFDFSIQTDPAPIGLVEQISAVLERAGWARVTTESGPIVFNIPGEPPAGVVSFSGLQIQITESRRADWDNAVATLWNALLIDGLQVTALAVPDNEAKANAVHIMVGKKP
jgi:hypothetical protein